jgi:hypothetical protein
MSTPPSPSSADKTNLYEHALTLIEHQFQIFWLVFGAFLLAETVLLGGIGSMAKDGPPELVCCASFLGFVLTVPWWTSFRYNHAMYVLRIMQARQYEPDVGSFLTEGQKLIDGDKVHGLTMPCSGRCLPPRKADAFLIFAFALAFLALSWCYRPWHSHQQPPAPPRAALLYLKNA